MEAKDTVMSDAELMSWHLRPLECRRAIALAQAEITAPIFFEEGRKAGIREVVKWIEYYSRQPQIYPEAGNVPMRGIFEEDWQAKRKDWGIE